LKLLPTVFSSVPHTYDEAGAGCDGSTWPMTIRTSGVQWAYGAVFDRAAVNTSIAGMIVVRVRIQVLSGSVGVGCLDVSGQVLLDEQSVNRSDVPTDVYVLASTSEETGALVVRNTYADGPSEARLSDIACFETDAAEATREPRVPPLSEPPVVNRWSRFYGNQDLTVSERLRARAFERIKGTHLLTWSDGMSFRVVEGDQLSRALFVSGTYEPNTLRVLRALLRDGDVFIDVGANAGVISMAASQWVGSGRVFSIEPSAREFERLTDNIERNHISNIAAFRIAVGSHSGTVNLNIASDMHGGLNTLGAGFPYEGVERLRTEAVPATTLDDFVEMNGIKAAVVKLDIEGAEGEALTGAQRLLSDMRPALVIEVFSKSLEAQGWTRSKLAELLGRADYVTYSIDDVTGRLRLIPDLDTADEQNVVALPQHAPVPQFVTPVL
jgi:FkbM family methyltransferase